MWDRLLQLLPVGCRHRHMSLPFSAAPPTKKHSSQPDDWERVAEPPREIYVVCLDCGRHFNYDWSRMRVIK